MLTKVSSPGGGEEIRIFENLGRNDLCRLEVANVRKENLGRNKPGVGWGWGKNKDLWPEYPPLEIR